MAAAFPDSPPPARFQPILEQAHFSEQSDYLAVLVKINLKSGGRAAQAGHGSHVAADRIEETGSD